MAAKNIKMVHCRYPKCSKLHESTELNKEDAIQGGRNSYYHPDCYHMMQTVNQIKDTFINEINPLLTGQQIGVLISTINNIVFGKGIEVDFVKFAVDYFVKYKPGALKYPLGLHYIIQDKDVISSWEREKERKIRKEIKEKQNNIVVDEFKLELDSVEINTQFKNSKSKFSSVLGV